MRAIDPVTTLIPILMDGQYHSQQELAAYFGVARSTVHQYIKILQSMGIDVIHCQRTGYCLITPIDLLDKDKILAFLPPDIRTCCVIFSRLSSTNQYLLEKIEDLSQGTFCLAEYQYQGRGRRGRPWFSPFGTSLNLSVYWRFQEKPETLFGLSQALSISIAKILCDLSGKNIKVKWPNDLYLDNKKLAGILVEMTSRDEKNLHVVVGIGINLTVPQNKISIDQRFANLGMIDRNVLAAQLITSVTCLFKEFKKRGLHPWLSDWNRLDTFYHRPVRLIMADKEICGINRGINEEGALQLDQNGKVTSYLAGEISLRAESGL